MPRQRQPWDEPGKWGKPWDGVSDYPQSIDERQQKMMNRVHRGIIVGVLVLAGLRFVFVQALAEPRKPEAKPPVTWCPSGHRIGHLNPASYEVLGHYSVTVPKIPGPGGN